jgi:hypothetical protein
MVLTKKIFKVNIKDKTSQKKLVMMKFTGAKIKKSDMQKEADKVSRELKNKGAKGEIMVQINFGKKSPIEFGSAGWSKIGKNPKLFNIIDYAEGDFEEPEYFSNFNILVRNQ